MSESLYSPSWYRVAALKPRLRSHAQIHRHVYRDAVWYVLQDHASGRFHRFTPVSHAVIGLLDGRRTVQEIWDIACTRLGDDAPSQDEVITLLSELHKADVLQSDAPPDMTEQHRRRTRRAAQRWKQYFGNPMSLRFPLIDPDRLLVRLMPLLRPLFGWTGAALWVLFVTIGAVLAARHWFESSNGVIDNIFSLENLLLMALIYPCVKVLHEFGHAIALRALGGEVHEMGMMFLVLMPTPYVDASASTAFRDKRLRMLVGAAGMLTELLIAAFATIAWVYLEPGLARTVMYNIMLIAGVSTLIFNANPLLRYDGYYILADWLEIPNLGQRANEYLGYLVNRYLFGVERTNAPMMARGERGWFVFYAITSFFYRIFISLTIILIVAGQFFFIGVVLAIWAAVTMLLAPLGKKLKFLFSAPLLRNRRARALGVSGAVLGALLAVIGLLPAPYATRSEGVIWAPEQAQVRAGTDGFIVKVMANPNSAVRKGQALMQMEDPELAPRLRVLMGQLEEIRGRYDAAIVRDKVQAGILREQAQHVISGITRARERLAALTVLSPSDGVFVVENVQNVPGHFARRGDLLAYVTDENVSTVRVVVPQADVDLVRSGTRRVEIKAVDQVAKTVEARVLRLIPAATDVLPSMTLALQGGGTIGLDPAARAGEAKALEKLFVVDLALPPRQHANTLGSRMYVRFEHQHEVLAVQWYRAVRRLFLKKFNV